MDPTPKGPSSLEATHPADFVDKIQALPYGITQKDVVELAAKKAEVKPHSVYNHLRPGDPVQKRGWQTRQKIMGALAGIWEQAQKDPFACFEFLAYDLNPLKEAATNCGLTVAHLVKLLDFSSGQRRCLYLGDPVKLSKDQEQRSQELMATLQDPEQTEALIEQLRPGPSSPHPAPMFERILESPYGLSRKDVLTLVGGRVGLTSTAVRTHLKPGDPVRKRALLNRQKIVSALADIWEEAKKDPFACFDQVACDLEPLYGPARHAVPVARLSKELDLSSTQRRHLCEGETIKLSREQYGKALGLAAALGDPEQCDVLQSRPKPPPPKPASPLSKITAEDHANFNAIQNLLTEIFALNPSVSKKSLAAFISDRIFISASAVAAYFRKKILSRKIQEQTRRNLSRILAELRSLLKQLSENPFLVTGTISLGTAFLRHLLKERKVPITVAAEEIGWRDAQRTLLRKGDAVSVNSAQLKAYKTFAQRIRADEEYCERLRKRAIGKPKPKKTALPEEDWEFRLGIHPNFIASTVEFPYGWGFSPRSNGAGGSRKYFYPRDDWGNDYSYAN